MKKKITAFVLAVIMCLSFIISAAAADTLKRVPSTIPGTDTEYNYVENVTVKIPGTNVTYELNDVYEKVGLVYENDIPVYRFSFLEKDSGSVILKQDGDYAEGYDFYRGYTELNSDSGKSWTGHGEAINVHYKSNDTLNLTSKYADYYESHNVAYRNFRYACIQADGTVDLCENGYFVKNNHTCIAKIEFYWGTGCKCDNGYESPYDLISFGDGSYYDTLLEEEVKMSTYGVSKDIEKIDISLLDVNYKLNEEYRVIEASNSVVNSDTKSLKIRADGDFSKFTGVKVDGKTVDSSNYTASEGSTVVEFKDEYLNTLSAGKHTVEICFTDGEATTQFEIKRDKNTDKTDKPQSPNVEIPNTDGGSSVPSVFVVMALGGMALITFKNKKKK